MTVREQVAEAYYDCWGQHSWEEGSSRRKLDFLATESVSRDEAIEIFRAYVPGYNDFEPDVLLALPVHAQVTIAREGSVCIYVKGRIDDVPRMAEDERDYEPDDNETRLWWD